MVGAQYRAMMCRYILCLQVAHGDGTAVIMNRMSGTHGWKAHEFFQLRIIKVCSEDRIKTNDRWKLGYGFARDLGTVTW